MLPIHIVERNDYYLYETGSLAFACRKIIVSDDVITIKHIIPHDDNYRLLPHDNPSE